MTLPETQKLWGNNTGRQTKLASQCHCCCFSLMERGCAGIGLLRMRVDGFVSVEASLSQSPWLPMNLQVRGYQISSFLPQKARCLTRAPGRIRIRLRGFLLSSLCRCWCRRSRRAGRT